MLKIVDYDIVFAEVPDEVTLAFNLSRCPNRCEGCHSPQLWRDIGEPLTPERLDNLVGRYRSGITCICFMGGDGDTQSLVELTDYVRRQYPELRRAWYSGRAHLPKGVSPLHWDYIKLGPYIPSRGPLNKRTTNQHFYRVLPNGRPQDITYRFLRNETLLQTDGKA
ncbi:MAG: anaerobic ribonucleoside-triphosphate reductase activating protein [Bacteroidales bacterium]|nr:anaerobic ribonucleoside-triphosphate reductase activating protein [Bacteroidales bacterium]